MIFNDTTLFLHYPKTAGKSVTKYLVRNLPKPIYGVVSPGQIGEIGLSSREGVHLTVGSGHQNLRTAPEILEGYGRSVEEFHDIVVVARNPYTLIYSNYQFLRRSYADNPAVRQKKNFKLAHESTFAEFCEQMKPLNFRGFVEINDGRPDNIAILRFENLQEDLGTLLKCKNIEITYPLPKLNAAPPYIITEELFSSRVRYMIETKMAAMFEIGGYEFGNIPGICSESKSP